MSLMSFRPFLLSGLLTGTLFAQKGDLPISFSVPKAWKLIEAKRSKGTTFSLYEIPNDQTKNDEHIPSNALIQYYRTPKGVSPLDADRIVGSRVKNATLVLSGQDGDNWKTYIYVASEKKQQVIILYRIGILKSFGVEVMMCFPAPTRKADEPLSVLTINESTVRSESLAGVYCHPSGVREMVDQFNEFCASLRIANTNSFSAKIQFIDPPKEQ